MLDHVLKSPKLVSLKGIALEVDTKPIGMIVEEFRRFQKQFEWWVNDPTPRAMNSVQRNAGKYPRAKPGTPDAAMFAQDLVEEYEQYVGVVTGRANPKQKSLEGNTEEYEHQIEKYVKEYLPHEIMEWGGNLRDMFPHTIQRLEEHGIDLSTFVTGWYRDPRPIQEPYDFFLLKIDYFVEFVEGICPTLGELVSQEAKELREGYTLANNL